MNWEIGDVVICITPGSELENKEVTIISDAFVELDKIDLVHQVDPGFSPGEYSGGGPKGGTCVHCRIRTSQVSGMIAFSSPEN